MNDRDRAATPERARRDSGFTRGSGNYDSNNVMVDIKNLNQMIEGGELDKMDEQQFMVFMQKVTRTFTTQRDVPFHERSAILDNYNRYV